MGPDYAPRERQSRFLAVVWRGVFLAAFAVVAGLVTGAFILSRGGDGGSTPARPLAALTQTPAPTVSPLPALPASCQLIASGHFGDGPVVDVPSAIEITAQPCAARAYADSPLESLTATLLLQLQAPDGPAEVSVLLPASRDGDELSWAASVTYPLAGVWTSEVTLGALTLSLPPSEVRTDFVLTSPSADLPLGAAPQELTVLHVDRDEEPVRWEAAPYTGAAWIPGDMPGEPARAVWVQTREGADWVVAGDPTDGEVTPLFEVDGTARIVGAPDGRGLVVIDGDFGAVRLRVYNAEQQSLIEVPVAPNSHPTVSWSPDSSVVIVGEERLHLLRSDGSAILVRDEVASSAEVEWSLDSKSALVSVSDRSISRIIRVDVNTSTTSVAFEYGNGVERRGQGNLAMSPDGKWAALGWLNTPDRTLRIAIVPAEQPFPTPLVDHTVVTYQLPAEPGRLEWIDTLVWSPDGQQLAFALGALDPPPEALRPLTTLQVLDVQSGTVRELARPAQGYYSGGPLWWSTDGSAVFKQWFGCVQCDGGGSGIDVASVAEGTVVRTIEQGAWLGTLDGVRQLIATPQELLAVSGLEPPRALMPQGQTLRTSYTAVASPDGNWLAVTEALGAVNAVVAAAEDGSSQELLGTTPRGAVIEGMRDESRVLTLDAGGVWGWGSLVGEQTQPLPRPEGAAPVDKVAAAFSSDGSHLAYGASTSEGTLQLFVLDLGTDEARALDVFIQEAKGMALSVSSDGSHVAYLEGGDLVAVDAATGQSQRFGLGSMGYGTLAEHTIAFAWDGDGSGISAVVGGKLWRADLASGGIAVVTDQPPTPGGWRGDIVLSRSPDGEHLVAGTSFGMFALQADGGWGQVSGAGIERGAIGAARFAWSPDSSQFAYSGAGDAGVVVGSVDGAGAYELVRRDPARLMRVLKWLPDGRIVYALIARGI